MALKSLHEITSIWRQQTRNWRIVVTRRVFNRFFDQLTLEYANIYVSKLGASSVQLGESPLRPILCGGDVECRLQHVFKAFSGDVSPLESSNASSSPDCGI
jgi:hypothetical protein